MRLPKKIGMVLVVAASGLAVSASAVTHTGGGSVSRVNAAGSTYLQLGPVSSEFCYLNGVIMENGDAVGENTQCLIFPNGSNWLLAARLGQNGDAVVTCAARCYTTN